MKTQQPVSKTTPESAGLPTFLEDYSRTLRSVFRDRADDGRIYLTRGLPPSVMREILAHTPLSPFIPKRYGGTGEHIGQGLAVMDATGYESLAMALSLGINGALFLQPVSKYGREEIKGPIFRRFQEHQNMGGLMMTEPDFGSDALNMETAYAEEDGGRTYRIQGVKHWAGLTGLADYWLVVARSRNPEGQLSRDVDFFVCDTHQPSQAIRVEERFESLGLLPIPYGRNRIDVRVPAQHRLEPHTTGLKMMLDMLHRSRMQFPGMGTGFIRRLYDEAVSHARERFVGGKPLFDYDQVQRRLARLQASLTAGSAMCVFCADHAGVEHDLSKEGIRANAVKAVVTDLMHEAAQSFLQLVGAKGYRFDHLAGRSLVDSRPFQIFEGSNDILYEQLAQGCLNAMKRGKHRTLHEFLSSFEPTARAADLVRRATDIELDAQLPQRALVDLGKALGRVCTMEFVIEYGERGYPGNLVESCLDSFRREVAARMGDVTDPGAGDVEEDVTSTGRWFQYTAAAAL